MEGWTFPTPLTIAIRVLETLFVLGVVGSAVVVVLTGVEDFKMLFMKRRRPGPAKIKTTPLHWAETSRRISVIRSVQKFCLALMQESYNEAHPSAA